jgi:hypothetical protein
MLPNRDFKDLLSELNAHGVEFLVIGAHALAAHDHVRATKDLDVWVRPEPENATRVVAALEAFGAPMHALTEADFASPGITFQIGVEPVRIETLAMEAWQKTYYEVRIKLDELGGDKKELPRRDVLGGTRIRRHAAAQERE